MESVSAVMSESVSFEQFFSKGLMNIVIARMTPEQQILAVPANHEDFA